MGYTLESTEGSQYRYRIEGNALAVNQYDLGDMILLRVEKEDVSEEELERLKERFSQAAGNKQVVILPPWVSVLKVSQMVHEGTVGKTMECRRCGSVMRQFNHGGFLCLACGNEIAPSPQSGTGINMGGLP